MINLGEAVKKHQDGAILNIFVNTGSHTNIFPAGFNKWRNRIEIMVTSPPKDNKANIDVIKTTAKFFDIPVSNIFMISGGKSKEKTILIKGVTQNNAIKILRETLDGLQKVS